MTIRLNQVTVGTTPTLVVSQVPGQGATIIFTNGSSSDPVYLGFGTKVTVSNGAVIPPFGVVPMSDAVSTQPIYGIASGTTVTVGVFYGDLQ